MKKVIYVIVLLFAGFYVSHAQKLLVKNEVNPTKVSSIEKTNNSVYDYSAVEQIRAHIIGDQELSTYMDLYRPAPQMKVEVSVSSNGLITDVDVIEGGSGEHAYHLKKSIQKLKQVTPIKLEGIYVNQKVQIPVTFR